MNPDLSYIKSSAIYTTFGNLTRNIGIGDEQQGEYEAKFPDFFIWKDFLFSQYSARTSRKERLCKVPVGKRAKSRVVLKEEAW